MRRIVTISAILCLMLGMTGCGSKNAQQTPNSNGGNSVNKDSSADQELPPELTPDQIEARRLFEQANDLAREDEDAAAAEIYQKAISLDPDFADAHLKLAMSFEVLDKREEATAEYEKAAEAFETYVRKNQKDPRAYFNMGLAYNRLGKPNEAVRAFRQAVKLEPENSDNQYELGVAYGKAAQYQESVTALQKATQLDPDNYRAQEALEQARINLQRWQAMVKQQEAIAKRQAAKNANAASANAPPSSGPLPDPR